MRAEYKQPGCWDTAWFPRKSVRQSSRSIRTENIIDRWPRLRGVGKQHLRRAAGRHVLRLPRAGVPACSACAVAYPPGFSWQGPPFLDQLRRLPGRRQRYRSDALARPRQERARGSELIAASTGTGERSADVKFIQRIDTRGGQASGDMRQRRTVAVDYTANYVFWATQVEITPPNRRDGRSSVAAVRRFRRPPTTEITARRAIERPKPTPSPFATVWPIPPEPRGCILPASSGGGRRENAARPRRRGGRAGRPHGLQRAVDLPAVRRQPPRTRPPPRRPGRSRSTPSRSPSTATRRRSPGTPTADLLRRHLVRRQHLPRQSRRPDGARVPRGATRPGRDRHRHLRSAPARGRRPVRRHPRLRPADQAAGRRVQHGTGRDASTACTSPTRGTSG